MARLSLFLSFLSVIALISSVNGRVLNSLSADKSILVSDGSQEESSYEILTLDPLNRLFQECLCSCLRVSAMCETMLQDTSSKFSPLVVY
ncbi:unnamed protein product [Brassica napus]|nr:unnamed protein product [Brassica napus]